MGGGERVPPRRESHLVTQPHLEPGPPRPIGAAPRVARASPADAGGPAREGPLGSDQIGLPGDRDPRTREADEHGRPRWPRTLARVHSRFARRQASLLAVAGGTGGDDVLPHRLAPAAAGDHMIHGEARRLTPAVLARPGIPGEDRL